jgi:tetratricopeptide (TPR) repeat protein
MAEAALSRGDLVSARELAANAASADASQPDYATLLAWVRALDGDALEIEEAITTMTRVLADDPSSERALLYRGKLFARTNRVREALADFNEVLGANPKHRDAQAEVRLLESRMTS